MGWFKRLFGGAEQRASMPTGPVLIDLIPGKLAGKVYVHDFRNGPQTIPCWTYVTEGFNSLGQKEFVFTLVRGSSSDPAKPPDDPLRFFTQIFTLAEQKQFVDEGGFTTFQPQSDGFLGLSGLLGFTYTQTEVLPGVEMPAADRCLAAILLVVGEAAWVQVCGSYRVLSRLGRSARYYPHPPWCDPCRAAVLTTDELSNSLLGKMPVAYLDGAFVRQFLHPTTVPKAGESGEGSPLGDRVTFRIRRDRLPRVQEVLAKLPSRSEGALAFTLTADPEANLRLAWQPDDTALHTITPATGDASCLTGGFLAMVYGPGMDYSGRVIEDGFMLTMGIDTWVRLRDALTNGEALTLPAAPGQIGLSVEWTGGPVEKRKEAKTTSSTFHIVLMVLYQPDEVLRARLPSVTSVGELVKQVESVADEFWNEQPKGIPQPVLVVVAIKPGGRMRVWVDVLVGLGTEKAAQECTRRLERLPCPAVQHGPVAIALRASLWGGSGEWQYVPQEWQDAATAAGQELIVPDGILERIWPG
jgi:hypothetical protein